MSKPFASSADLEAKKETLSVLADGVYALTAEGDPNVGAIEAEDFLIAFEARATPAAARDWLKMLREHTDKPINTWCFRITTPFACSVPRLSVPRKLLRTE